MGWRQQTRTTPLRHGLRWELRYTLRGGRYRLTSRRAEWRGEWGRWVKVRNYGTRAMRDLAAAGWPMSYPAA